jgi:hypothetical protein
MNVQLLPGALADVQVLRASGFRGSGLLLGTEMGRVALVERLLPLDVGAGKRGSAALAAACATYGERLQGVFFCRRPPLALAACVGDLVLAIRRREIAAFTCEFAAAAGGGRARLEPLLEDAEGG